MVWIFSLSLKACTMEKIEGEELVYCIYKMLLLHVIVIACYMLLSCTALFFISHRSVGKGVNTNTYTTLH
jgi:hypothetical protein